MPYHMDVIEEALNGCDVFAAIGTSGQVYPAAGFVAVAAAAGARTIEFNLAATAPFFTEHHEGPATATVPAWVDSLLQVESL
jgi:NAD-dependent deacetylase